MLRRRRNLMRPIRWIGIEAASILDVGCNAGELLALCRAVVPGARLAGIESN